MPTSYTNHYLHIDLTTGQCSTFALPEDVLERYVGGKGIGAYLLAQHQDPEADAVRPGQSAHLRGGAADRHPGAVHALAWSCSSRRSRTCSPTPTSAVSSGRSCKAAGYDGMVITGAAAEPVYLEINNEQVAIKPAGHLWGLDTFDTYERLRPDYPDKEWRIACIGPAGENRVAFAVIDCDWHRQAGRGGGGAVMGAKNLKAIVVRGTGRVRWPTPRRSRKPSRPPWAP